MTTKVFIVDDHYMVIEGIRSLLQHEKDIDWFGHATNASSCLAFLEHQLPDVILMDINLPDKSGIDLCKEVREKHPSVFIIGLSTFNQQPIWVMKSQKLSIKWQLQIFLFLRGGKKKYYY